MFSWDLITGNEACTVDSKRLRQAFGTFATGVCVVTTTAADGKREGMTINSFASVSLSPPLILWSIRDDARSADAFIATRGFAVNVLGARHRDLAMHFARPALDKFSAHEDRFRAGLRGVPVLVDALASYECTTYSRHQEGDHTILIGRVDHFTQHEVEPLVFCGGQLGSLREVAGVGTETASA